VRLVYQDQVYACYGDPVFRVVRRDEFDHWLVCCGEQHGLAVRQGEAVIDVTPYPDYIEVLTTQATFHARTVVAADGSRSFVRQKLNWVEPKRMARLLEILTPEVIEKQPAFYEGIAVFDFSPMAAGLQGYYWDFPSLIKGQAFMNRGIFDSRVQSWRSRVPLKEALRVALAQRGRNLEDYPLKGHPIHRFDKRGPFARPRLIFAGDAAGVDPFVGEGISFALGYGQVAAAAVLDAFARQDFTFATYQARVLTHPLLSQLRFRARLARLMHLFPYPWLIRYFWRLSGLIISSLNWYHPNWMSFNSPRLLKISK
jgi:flavin-dependent dehydrogenase